MSTEHNPDALVPHEKSADQLPARKASTRLEAVPVVTTPQSTPSDQTGLQRESAYC
jgi:hypothetical protein